MIDRKTDLRAVRTALKRSRVVSILGPRQIPSNYWATHNGAELDLLLFKDGRRIGVECKRADAPALTSSMRIALSDLKLDVLRVVYPGAGRYSLGERVEVVPLAEFVVAS